MPTPPPGTPTQAPEHQAILKCGTGSSPEAAAELAARAEQLGATEAQLLALSDALAAREAALLGAEQTGQHGRLEALAQPDAVDERGSSAVVEARWRCLAAQRAELAARWQCLLEDKRQLSLAQQKSDHKGKHRGQPKAAGCCSACRPPLPGALPLNVGHQASLMRAPAA